MLENEQWNQAVKDGTASRTMAMRKMAPTPGDAVASRELSNRLTIKTIARLLSPWMDVFHTSVTWYANGNTVIARFSANTTKLLTEETNRSASRYTATIGIRHAHNGACRVWEAIQLLGYAMALDPLVLLALSNFKIYDTAKANATISKCEKCILKFDLSYFSLDMVVLQESIGKSFFQPPTSTSPTLQQYKAVRIQLVGELKRRQLDDRLLEPLEVSFKITPSNDPNKVPTPFETEDFLSYLTTFVLQIHKYHDESHHAHDGHRAIRVKEVCLADVGCLMLITDQVAIGAQDMMSKSYGLVTYASLSLDPRAITCGTDALIAYLAVFQPFHEVRIGVPVENRTLIPIDGRGEDRRRVLGTIMDAVAGFESISYIDITPILALMTQPSNREFFWQKMPSIVLSGEDSSTPLDIVIDAEQHGGDSALLEPEDARFIRSARERAGNHLRRVDQLELTFEAVDESALVELVGLMKDMAGLQLYYGIGGTLDSSTVSEVLLCCRAVQKLTLVGICVDSMAVFVDFCERRASSGPFVESMRIANLYVNDESSIGMFFRAIGDSTSEIGKHLHTLDMSENAQSINPYFALDASALECVELALQTNRVLRDLQLVIQEDVPQEFQDAVLKHNGDILICTKPDPDHNARKVAFMGAIQSADTNSALSGLDALSVQLIFDFCQPYEIRRIQLETINPV